VERAGDPLSGAADAHGQVEWRMRALGDHAIDLLGECQNSHVLFILSQYFDESSRERSGIGGRAEATVDLIAQVIVDV
jgi:hypothetical protein